MSAFIANPTEYTPKIVFDTQNHVLEVSGFSRPEDVKSFYQKFFVWLESNKLRLSETINGQAKLLVDFRMVYFNSASSKCILDMLTALSDVYGKRMEVKWYYEEGDEDLLEAGEEFSDALEIPFEYIETE
jgi:hypothetical protein